MSPARPRQLQPRRRLPAEPAREASARARKRRAELAGLDAWDRTLWCFQRASGSGTYGGAYGEDWWLGVFQRDTRLARRGDVVLGTWSNGQARQMPVSGYTSRGRCLVHYYVTVQRWAPGSWMSYARERRVPRWQRERAWRARGEDRASEVHVDHVTVRVLEDGLPGEVTTAESPALPAVRAYVLGTLRAGDAARPVGASSRASSSGGA